MMFANRKTRSQLITLFQLIVSDIVGTFAMAWAFAFYNKWETPDGILESFGIAFSMGAIVTLPLCLIFGSVLVTWFRRKQWHSVKAYSAAAFALTVMLTLLWAGTAKLLSSSEQLTLVDIMLLFGWCAAGSFPAIFTYYGLQIVSPFTRIMLLHLLIAGIVGTIILSCAIVLITGVSIDGAETIPGNIFWGCVYLSWISIPFTLVVGSFMVLWFRRKGWRSPKAFAVAAFGLSIMLAPLVLSLMHLVIPETNAPALQGIFLMMPWLAGGIFPAILTYLGLEKYSKTR